MSAGWQPEQYDPRHRQPSPPSRYQQPQYLPQPYQPQYPPRQWQPQVAPKSPALGLIVSVFLPGVGSMMAGRAGKGTGILAGYLAGCLLCLVVIGLVIAPVFWVWGLVAAHGDAVRWNAEHGIIS